MTTDLRYLLDMVPADVREACASALEQGQARAEGRELVADVRDRTPAQARPPRALIPVHPETAPRWYRDELRALARGDRPPSNRAERRALAAAVRIAEGRVEEVRREAYRARQRAHQRAHRRRWQYLRQPAAPDDCELGRAPTAQQFIASRAALADEWGARATVAAMPAGVAAALAAWVRELAPCDAYGSPWASRLVRRTVSTCAAILWASRPSWRDGYALVTTGMGRKRLASIMGPAPESGRRYSLSSLSHVDYGSLAVLEDLGIVHRTQLPGDVVPGCDRGRSGYAFNHYLVPSGMVRADDAWGDPSRVNTSTPRELLEEVAPWCAAPGGELERLATVRARALAAALEQVAGEDLVEQLEDELGELAEDLVDAPARPPPD